MSDTMNIGELTTSDMCRACGNLILNHTMWFTAEGMLIDTSKPLKCPLGQASDWVPWADALPVSGFPEQGDDE